LNFFIKSYCVVNNKNFFYLIYTLISFTLLTDHFCRRQSIQTTKAVTQTMKSRSTFYCVQKCAADVSCNSFNIVPSGSNETVCKLTTGSGNYEIFMGLGYIHYVMC